MVKRNTYTNTHSGFTIVELLIVIVVISILAAITIVSYNGISSRAAASVAQANAATAARKVAAYAAENSDAVPSSAAILSSLGLTNSSDVKYQYTVDNANTTFCLTVTSKTQSYYVSSAQQSPTSGLCPGHNASGISSITNFALNPSFEAASPTFTGPSSSVILLDTTRAHSGTHSARATMPNSAAYSVGIKIYSIADLTTDLKPNTNYTVSSWVYVPSGTVEVQLSVQGSARGTPPPFNSEQATTIKDQWVRIWRPFSTLSSGTIAIYVQNTTATGSAGTQFWTDDIMVTEGTSPPSYADGNSSGWSWNGTVNSSTSTGIPL